MSAFNRVLSWCETCEEETSHIQEDNIISCEGCNMTEEVEHGC